MLVGPHAADCPCCQVYKLTDPQPEEALTAPDLDLHVALTGRTRAEVASDVHDLRCLLAMKLNQLDIHALNELLVAQYGDFDLSPDEALSLEGARYDQEVCK